LRSHADGAAAVTGAPPVRYNALLACSRAT